MTANYGERIHRIVGYDSAESAEWEITIIILQYEINTTKLSIGWVELLN